MSRDEHPRGVLERVFEVLQERNARAISTAGASNTPNDDAVNGTEGQSGNSTESGGDGPSGVEADLSGQRQTRLRGRRDNADVSRAESCEDSDNGISGNDAERSIPMSEYTSATPGDFGRVAELQRQAQHRQRRGVMMDIFGMLHGGHGGVEHVNYGNRNAGTGQSDTGGNFELVETEDVGSIPVGQQQRTTDAGMPPFTEGLHRNTGRNRTLHPPPRLASARQRLLAPGDERVDGQLQSWGSVLAAGTPNISEGVPGPVLPRRRGCSRDPYRQPYSASNSRRGTATTRSMHSRPMAQPTQTDGSNVADRQDNTSFPPRGTPGVHWARRQGVPVSQIGSAQAQEMPLQGECDDYGIHYGRESSPIREGHQEYPDRFEGGPNETRFRFVQRRVASEHPGPHLPPPPTYGADVNHALLRRLTTSRTGEDPSGYDVFTMDPDASFPPAPRRVFAWQRHRRRRPCGHGVYGGAGYTSTGSPIATPLNH